MISSTHLSMTFNFDGYCMFEDGKQNIPCSLNQDQKLIFSMYPVSESRYALTGKSPIIRDIFQISVFWP